jgi:hypothetical protein
LLSRKFGWNPAKKAKVGVLALLLLISISSIAVALLFMMPQNYPLLKQDTSALYSANYLSISNDFKTQSTSPSFLFTSSQPNAFTYPKDVLRYYPNRNDSNVDNSPSIGYHSAFVNQQIGPDGINDTLYENNEEPSRIEILVPNEPGNYTNLTPSSEPNWNCCKSFDEDNSYVYLHSKKDTGWVKDTYNLTNPRGSGIINWIKVGISVKTKSSDLSQGLAATYILSGSTELPVQIHYYIPKSYTNFSDVLIYNPDTGKAWTWSDLENLQAGCVLRLNVDKEAWVMCTFVWVEVNYTIPNYELDLEVQWTGIPTRSVNSTLCIKTGNNSGNENLSVDYWTGGNYFKNGYVWEPLIPVLLPDQWNNVSVKIDNPVFTIRFKGLNETEDETPDYWNIDVSLIEIAYNPPETYSTSLFLMILSGFLLGGGSQPSLPPAAIIFGAVSLFSVSGLVIRHFFAPGEDASFRRRRIKQLDDARKRVQRALEGNGNGKD